jgi:hypothetical protein
VNTANLASQWQTWVALAIAAGCAVWVAWRLVRPFIGRARSVCQSGCGSESCGAGEPGMDDLIQIEAAAAGASPSPRINAQQQSH